VWLGASVMVDYTIEEALELLKGNVDEIMAELERIRVFLDYVQDQITTTEVMMARFYNHDVKVKRAAAGK
jgi:prefoldin subunit 5